jgi:hypothetical protein
MVTPFKSAVSADSRRGRKFERPGGNSMSRNNNLSSGIASVGAAVAVAAIAIAAALPSYAQSDYPNRPIRILVGFSAGGPSDIIARIVGAKTGEFLGQQVVVENKTGAGGMIASEATANAPPDGCSTPRSRSRSTKRCRRPSRSSSASS